MKTIPLLILFFVNISLAFTQGGPFLFSGTNFMANGQIGLLAEDAEAVIVLPALLATRDHGGWTAGVSTRSGLDDYTEVAGAFHIQLPWKDQIGLAVQHAGIEGYTEQRIVMSYARKLVATLQAGLQFDYNRNAAEEYDALATFSWGVSLRAAILNNLSMSAYVYNPLGTEDELDIPSVLRVGVLYAPGDLVGVAIEAEKDWREDMRFKAGFNYHIHPRLCLRWGVVTSPSTMHAGIGYNILNNMALNGGWKYHAKLGSAFAASISQYQYK